jgi:hypothetical protein
MIKITMNNESEGMLMEAVIISFKVQPWHWNGENGLKS